MEKERTVMTKYTVQKTVVIIANTKIKNKKTEKIVVLLCIYNVVVNLKYENKIRI